MRKTVFIAMFFIAALFVACNKEKPYEKFVGAYTGTVLLEGTVNLATPVPSSVPSEVTLPLDINLQAGDADDKLKLVFSQENEDQNYVVEGTVSGNTVVFEPFVLKKDIDGSEVDITLNMDGTLEGITLSLSGTFSGSGNKLVSTMLVPFTVDGTVTGTLDKLLAE